MACSVWIFLLLLLCSTLSTLIEIKEFREICPKGKTGHFTGWENCILLTKGVLKEMENHPRLLLLFNNTERLPFDLLLVTEVWIAVSFQTEKEVQRLSQEPGRWIEIWKSFSRLYMGLFLLTVITTVIIMMHILLELLSWNENIFFWRTNIFPIWLVLTGILYVCLEKSFLKLVRNFIGKNIHLQK